MPQVGGKHYPYTAEGIAAAEAAAGGKKRRRVQRRESTPPRRVPVVSRTMAADATATQQTELPAAPTGHRRTMVTRRQRRRF